ncbi:MAG TPA: TonB-dependent receptor [Opitutaceae bacterium]|nr:TonB-dependent receptor [Opitutaceae bacterium]
MKRDSMTHIVSSRRRSLRRFLAPLALAAAAALRAQTVPTQLVPVVVTATRLPESAATVGTDIEVVSGSDLARQQLSTLADALGGVPAAPAFATGQAGATTSLFLRGADSNQTLFLVDGIRLNDANADYNNFLGGARVFTGDTVEIARGPQSTLYGAEAVGGVVSLRINPGSGPFAGAVGVEAGSFGTVDGTVTAHGSEGGWGYNVEAAGNRTDNQRINNRFESGSLALRLDDRLSPVLSVGATVRGLDERYDDPGDEFTDNPYDYERERNWLATLFADARLTENLSSHLVLGGQDRRFDTYTPAPGQPTADAAVKNRRAVADWQVTGIWTANNKLTGGLTAEAQSTFDNGFGAIDRSQNLFALYAQDEWTPFPNVHLTGGVRRDDYNTFGDATTGRGTLAWLLADGELKLRASYGTGFNAPSFLDLYGQSAFFVGNPRVSPEHSRGEDAGFDYYMPSTPTVMSVSWFRTDYSSLIVDDFNVFPATTANVDRARTEGLEASLKTTLAFGVQAKLTYTYLQARNLTEGTDLLRRPRNSASGDLWRSFGAWSVGVGGAYVGHRPDIDALTFATVDDPGYSVFRVYAAWQLTRRLSLKARVENALDRRYEPVSGYPQPGTAAFGGVGFTF